MEDGNRPLSAKEKRQEQIRRWENSATDLECATYANPKIRVKFDDGAVFLAACSSGDLDEVKKLLKRGADINFANVDGLTALHQACIDGNLEVVKFLVEHGSEIDQEDNEGWTPLHATSSCGFMDIAKYLVDNNANVGAVNSEAELPIDIAEDDEMIEFLQSEIDRQGIDVEEARNIEMNVMMEDAERMLETYKNGEPVEIDRHQKSGATSLHITAAKGYNEVLKILIKAGFDVNLRDNDGWTPLHAASHWSQEESAKILSEQNADFRARSKLGQTPFDVADEDMLGYLNELEAEQQKNKPRIKEPTNIGSSVTKDKTVPAKRSQESLRDDGLQNGENKARKIEEITQDYPVDDVTQSNVQSSEKSSRTDQMNFNPPRDKDDNMVNDHSKISDKVKEKEEADLGRRSENRPTSLHLMSRDLHSLDSPTNENSTKPVAATQPVQSVDQPEKNNRENGSRTSSFSSRQDSPASWRSGLRKTGSFEEKTRPNFQTPGRNEERSSYSSRFNDDGSSKSENTRLARVAPILDARKNKEAENEDASINNVSGLQKGGSLLRRKHTTDTSATASDISNETTSFKRSSISEATDDASAQNDDTTKTADRRRSHLQPVRDEEAEAQRRARSRRERQTRRSTQGVTLDVVEEAMRTLGKMRTKQPSADKTNPGETASETTKARHGDYRRADEAPASSVPTQPTLPSGYIPSNQRFKPSTPDTKTAPAIPSITVQDAPEGETEKGENTTAESESNARKSAQLQRRRNRKERRSTGLPDLKPSSSTTENNDAGEEEETSPKDDASDSAKTERLRATVERYDSSSLPNRHRHRSGVLSSDSDLPSKVTHTPATDDIVSTYSSSRSRAKEKDYKQLYDDGQSENERLRTELSEAQRKITELQARLDRAEDNTLRRQALDNEKRERRALERKLADMEQEMKDTQSTEKLRYENDKLKAENTALVRIVEKLGGDMPGAESRADEEVASVDDVADSVHVPKFRMKNKKSESDSNLRILEKDDLEVGSESSASASRSSYSSYTSANEEPEFRRSSSASLHGTETFTRTGSLRGRETTPSSTGDSPSSSSLRARARLESSSSSPSLFTRSYSPRRTGTSNYSSASDQGYTPSYSSRSTIPSRKESSSSSTGSYTIPISSSRREFLRSLPTSTSVSYKPSSSSLRTTPASYSSTKSSYGTSPSLSSSSSSRPRSGYSSSTGRNGKSTLSKYSTTSGLGSSWRPLKY